MHNLIDRRIQKSPDTAIEEKSALPVQQYPVQQRRTRNRTSLCLTFNTALTKRPKGGKALAVLSQSE